MIRFRLSLMIILSCFSLFLAGCKSDEEKAEQFYQSGLALYEEGDRERALLELRNVFKYNGFHKEARQTYANILKDLGRQREAYSQYLRLIEQYPDTVDVRVTLAELAIMGNDWEEAERHGAAAQNLAPDRADVKAVGLALSYRDASLARDADARAKVADTAAQLLEQMRADNMPYNAALVRIVVDNFVRSETPSDALPTLNTALESEPDAHDLNLLKAQLLAAGGDIAGTGAQLRKMVEIFPEDLDIQKSLMNWYLAQNDLDGAEAYLREMAGDDATGPTEKHVTVMQFLQAVRGRPAAREELTRLIAANADTKNERFYRSMQALMDFEEGQTESAIADMRTILNGAEAGEQVLNMKAMLAQMLVQEGDADAADALVTEILAEDSSNVVALKMRASRMIDQDRSGEAIINLRAALSQAPRDAEILTLMALAHERDGDMDLVGERLALAVEVTNSAAPEAMRYARFLASQGRDPVAVNVLEDARRGASTNVELLVLLAEFHLKARDWSQAQSIVQALGKIDTPQAQKVATELQVSVLQGQNRAEESLTLLEGKMGEDTDATDAEIARATGLIVQTQIRSGKTDAARAALDQALADHPDNIDLQLLDANLNALMGEVGSAERGYRDLMKRFPDSELPVRLLFNMLESTGRQDEADKVLDAALETSPDQSNLLFMKAGRLEKMNDIDGAITIYERLYTLYSSNMLVANNFASMLANYRDDDESLARAATIARRLRGTQAPAFQDTYGWIAYRRGNLEEALKYLEPAAAALVEDPLVQYHLGMTYAALSRTEDARKALTEALKLADGSALAQFETARKTLAELETKAAP